MRSEDQKQEDNIYVTTAILLILSWMNK